MFDMFLLLAQSLVAALLTAPAPVMATHGASCTAESAPARIVRSSVADAPAIAKLDRLSGTAVVRVDLSDAGNVVGTYVARSSGSALLDRSALATAKMQAYAPETQACRAIAGSYAVEVEFAD
jgi:TonB family protein